MQEEECVQAMGRKDGSAFRHVEFEEPLIYTSKIFDSTILLKFQKDLQKRKILTGGIREGVREIEMDQR